MLFRHSASQHHQGHLSSHHQGGIQPKAGESQHKNPAESPGHLPVQGPVTLCCLLRSVLLAHCRLQGSHVSSNKDRREGDTCPLPSPTPESQQGRLLLHRQALHTQQNTPSRTLI